MFVKATHTHTNIYIYIYPFHIEKTLTDDKQLFMVQIISKMANLPQD